MALSHGLNFVKLALEPIELESYEPAVSALIVATLLTIFGIVAVKSLRSSRNPLIPDASLTLRNLFELVAGTVLSLSDSVLGKENRKYLPFLCTLFFYLFCLNLLGLVPGFSMPTNNPAINGGLAVMVFVLYNAWGVKAQGIVGHIKHFCGPIWWLIPLMLPIELISHCIRPVTLTARLFGNMTADHSLLTVFLGMTSRLYVPIPVVFYVLGSLVSLVQAFVFTVLTMVYIKLAVSHDESQAHDEAHEAH